MAEYKNYPIKECIETTNTLIEKQGGVVHQKYTCYRCKSRQTMAEPNKFFSLGTCNECGFVTDIERSGCNYVAIFSIR